MKESWLVLIWDVWFAAASLAGVIVSESMFWRAVFGVLLATAVATRSTYWKYWEEFQ